MKGIKRVAVLGKSYQSCYKHIEDARIAGRRYYPVTNLNQARGMSFDEVEEAVDATEIHNYDEVLTECNSRI